MATATQKKKGKAAARSIELEEGERVGETIEATLAEWCGSFPWEGAGVLLATDRRLIALTGGMPKSFWYEAMDPIELRPPVENGYYGPAAFLQLHSSGWLFDDEVAYRNSIDPPTDDGELGWFVPRYRTYLIARDVDGGWKAFMDSTAALAGMSCWEHSLEGPGYSHVHYTYSCGEHAA
jgi:hypothetical protein